MKSPSRPRQFAERSGQPKLMLSAAEKQLDLAAEHSRPEAFASSPRADPRKLYPLDKKHRLFSEAEIYLGHLQTAGGNTVQLPFC
jgi:hypothetical protein